MDLSQWNDRLFRHFKEVQRARQTRDTDLPVFALEHGLNQDQVSELSAAVHAQLRHGALIQQHALAWIVYATEIGYRYSGDEYWQTFEAETPGWTTAGDRYWIRDCFFGFHKEFGGAVPSGPFTHFSIICWPITHAILPRDLQQRLARILYEVRHSFSAELFESPIRLGEFIAARSWNETSRFQYLAQQEALFGQVATALLLQGNPDTDTLIHPATLRRIGDDVDRERQGREWLRGARRFAEERAKIRGLAIDRGKAAPASLREEARAEVTALGIEPQLLLRPTDATLKRWEVSVEIPDLTNLALRFPRVQKVLAESRCVVAGAAVRPLARGRCLHRPQRVTVSRWPRSDEVLLQFEQTDPQIEYLLRTECLLRPGPTWLFRIASDSIAYEMRGLRVRAGGQYILVSTDAPTCLPPVEMACEGVYGGVLELPDPVTPEWETTLRRLGITQAKSIEVWPAGLAAVVWDGEGQAEWLASERPCLAVRSDHAIGALVVSIGSVSEPPLELSGLRPGEPAFIEFPPLPLGLHRVHFAAKSGREADADLIGQLDVVMRIREARSWSPGISGSHGPLAIEIEPTAPTLEQLWDGRVEISVYGPEARTVRCRISMYNLAAETAIFVRQLPPLNLPVSSQQWRRHFERHLQGVTEAQNAYDETRICDIDFSAEELGAFTIRCEREFTPLRWSLRRNTKGYLARLHEDVGSGRAPIVERLSFEFPTLVERLDAMPEYVVPGLGGLYVARLSDFTAATIVPPFVRDLRDLRCVPCIESRERSLNEILRLIGLARLWGAARLPGNMLSSVRQREVLRAIAAHIFRLLGGDRWADAEAAAYKTRGDLADLKRSVSTKSGIAAVLARDCAALSLATIGDRVTRLASLAGPFVFGTRPVKKSTVVVAGTDRRGATIIRRRAEGPDNPTWLAELALRLASDPAHVEHWANEDLRTGVVRLIEFPTLARAARFLVLALALEQQEKSLLEASELYAGWGWSA